jgi:FdhD protein
VRTDVIRKPTTPARVKAWAEGRWRDRPDRLVTEEPMEIRIDAPGHDVRALAVVMRTPGHDFELAVGFCITEGILDSGADLAEVRYCLGPDAEQEYNVVTVATRRPVDLEGRTRDFVSGASCGVCGKATLDQLEVDCAPLGTGPTVPMATVLELPDRLRAGQAVFDATGGLHAAGLAHADGTVEQVREDVGRHNAVDKVVGSLFREGRLPLSDSILCVSGRASFEIVQKALAARIPIVAAVSAPSSLAIDLARESNMALAGFLREGGFNLYSGEDRLRTAAASTAPGSRG